MSAADLGTVGELLADSDALARETLLDTTPNHAPAMVRSWTQLVESNIRFDPQRGRYVCHEFCAVSDPGTVTTEALRHARIADWIRLSFLVNDGEEGSVIRELENADGRDPWALTAPDDVTQYGPTDRALRWVAHLYRYGLAVSYNPTKAVGESLKLPRSTAGRWIGAARSAGHLGPSEGVGKAGG